MIGGKPDVAERNAEHIAVLGYIKGLKRAADLCSSESGSYHSWPGDLALMDLSRRILSLIPEVAEGRMPDA